VFDTRWSHRALRSPTWTEVIHRGRSGESIIRRLVTKTSEPWVFFLAVEGSDAVSSSSHTRYASRSHHECENGLPSAFFLRRFIESRCFNHLCWVIWLTTRPFLMLWKRPHLTDPPSHVLAGIGVFPCSLNRIRLAGTEGKTKPGKATTTTN
jgi:hypothetical protein